MCDINCIIEHIRLLYANDSSGHDYWHSLRVYKNSLIIAREYKCDKEIVSLVALLHDVDDVKLFDTLDFANARSIMIKGGVKQETINRVVSIVGEISYRGKDTVTPKTIEGKIVQDADRLDALGAIGIARAFAYGGSRGREIYNPEIAPQQDLDAITYIESRGSSINHFYEKLFKLKDMMNTDVGKRIAAERDEYMHRFLDKFLNEWKGI